MGLVLQLFLPLSLAIISLSLGLGLVGDDFRRVMTRKKVFLTGLGVQLVILPVIAFVVIGAFGLAGALAAGLMLIAFCPGGTTSNLLTKMADGDVALSISLTAVTALLSVATVPVLCAWAVGYYMGEEAPEVSIAKISLAMFLMTTLPVAIGMLIRWRKPNAADVMEGFLLKIAGLLFVVIMVAAIAIHWQTLVSNFAILGPAVVLLCILAMTTGFGLASWLQVSWRERKAITVEIGIQAGVVAITLAGLIEPDAASLPMLALPAAVYGVCMYFIALPFVFWARPKS